MDWFSLTRVCMAMPGGGFGAPPGGGGFGAPPGGGFPSGGPYGPPPGGFGYTPPPPPKQMHTMAIVSLVAGLLSWFLCPLLGGIVAIVTGMMGRKDIRAEPQRWDGDGLALAGIILGGVNLAIYLFVIVLYVLILVGAMSAAALSP